MILHAGLIGRWSGGLWRGALIEGPSGAGKSDLAWLALQQGFRLIADDRVIAWTSRGSLYGRAPDVLHGLIEARGVDVLPCPALPFCRIVLAVRLADAGGAAQRIAQDRKPLLDLDLPVIELPALQASSPAKLAAAIDWLGRGPQQE